MADENSIEFSVIVLARACVSFSPVDTHVFKSIGATPVENADLLAEKQLLPPWERAGIIILPVVHEEREKKITQGWIRVMYLEATFFSFSFWKT